MTQGATDRRDRAARVAIGATALAALAFTSGAFAAPFAESAGLGWGGLLRSFYTPVCHQMPERSLILAQGTLAVCARCTGLYLGGVAGLLVAGWLVAGRRLRPRPMWLALAAAPILLDVALPWIGLQGLPNVSRTILALPAGFVAALFLAVGVGDLVGSRFRSQQRELAESATRRWVEDVDG